MNHQNGIRVAAGDYNIQQVHIAKAIEQLLGARDSLTRSPIFS
jgi:hypothetical protein